MAIVAPPKVSGNGGSGVYEESIEEEEGWKKVRLFMREQKVAPDGTFRVRGVIKKFIENPDNESIFFIDMRKDDKTGKDKAWVYVKVVVAITDDRFGPAAVDAKLELPPKNVGASFFDGYAGKDKPRSPLRGGMYGVHLAVTHREPGKELVRSGAFDPDDYTGRPVLLEVVYKGKVDEDSPYYGRRANLTLFLNRFERDPDSPNFVSDLDDEDEAI